MKVLVKLIDSRNLKTYEGYLTAPLQIGKPARVLFLDEKSEFYITNLRRFLYIGNHYWLIDNKGVKFTLIVQNN